MSEATILRSVNGPVGTLTINRPQALNALDVETLLAMERELTTLEADPAVRVIVFTGAGDRAFVAGGDIADLDSRQGLAHYLEFAEIVHRVFRRVEICDKPTICAINGWALGGGTELLLATDIRLAADHAKLGLPEITLGLFPGAGGSQRLIRQVSPCKARELMFVGDRITIVDHYLAGAYIVDPFHDAVRSGRRGLLVMRRLAPDRFTETEYYRRHYQATGILDEVGFILRLRHADAVLSLSRIGAVPAFSRRDIARLESAAPLVQALAERHWLERFSPTAGDDQAAAAISHPLLSKRELEIVTLILKGHSSYSIAATLGLSPNTVKVHRRQAYAKLGISSQAELFHLFLSRR